MPPVRKKCADQFRYRPQPSHDGPTQHAQRTGWREIIGAEHRQRRADDDGEQSSPQRNLQILQQFDAHECEVADGFDQHLSLGPARSFVWSFALSNFLEASDTFFASDTVSGRSMREGGRARRGSILYTIVSKCSNERLEMMFIALPITDRSGIDRPAYLRRASRTRHVYVVGDLESIGSPLDATITRHRSRDLFRRLDELFVAHYVQATSQGAPPMSHQFGPRRVVTRQVDKIIGERVSVSKQRPVHGEAAVHR